jgi:hypothetical protein
VHSPAVFPRSVAARFPDIYRVLSGRALALCELSSMRLLSVSQDNAALSFYVCRNSASARRNQASVWP